MKTWTVCGLDMCNAMREEVGFDAYESFIEVKAETKEEARKIARKTLVKIRWIMENENPDYYIVKENKMG